MEQVILQRGSGFFVVRGGSFAVEGAIGAVRLTRSLFRVCSRAWRLLMLAGMGFPLGHGISFLILQAGNIGKQGRQC